MKLSLGNILLTAGLGLLVYAGYQAMTCGCRLVITLFGDTPAPVWPSQLTHHPPHADREDLRLTQQEFEGLPAPLLTLLAAAVAVSLVGGLHASGELKPISLADAPQ